MILCVGCVFSYFDTIALFTIFEFCLRATDRFDNWDWAIFFIGKSRWLFIAINCKAYCTFGIVILITQVTTFFILIFEDIALNFGSNLSLWNITNKKFSSLFSILVVHWIKEWTRSLLLMSLFFCSQQNTGYLYSTFSIYLWLHLHFESLQLTMFDLCKRVK